MMLKYGYLMVTGAFPNKVTPYIDIKDAAVVQAAGNLQMITDKL